MLKRSLLFTFSAIVVVLTGCGTLESGKRYRQVRLEDLKTAYLVTPANANLTVSRHIGETLQRRGVMVRVGPTDPNPTNVDFVVTYTDRWNWDLKMYLESLQINFLDATNQEPIASGSYHQGVFHGYPDLEKTVQAVIESIYSAK